MEFALTVGVWICVIALGLVVITGLAFVVLTLWLAARYKL